MMKSILLLAFVCVLVGLVGGNGEEVSRHVSNLTRSSNDFALSLFHQLNTGEGSNTFAFSPFSIHAALTMTYGGATELTATQMRNVLNLEPEVSPDAAYLDLITEITRPGSVTLNVANAVYVNSSVTVKQAFLDTLTNFYNTSLGTIDLDAAGGAERPINEFVAEATDNNIRDLLPAGTIDRFTALVILNAIYFNGGWAATFDPIRTANRTFYISDSEQTIVEMMYRRGHYNYIYDNDTEAHYVELPYQDGRFSMFVILPASRNGLAAVETALSVQDLDSIQQSMSQQDVAIFLPKFRTEANFDLGATLRTMGMERAFGDFAEFSGISTAEDLKISKVFHKVVVEVSEQGTTAAAGTGVVISAKKSAMPTPNQFRADHPFIYVIQDNVHNDWLFVGKYSS